MRIYVKLFSTAMCWSGTFIAGRLLAGEVTPLSSAFLRFLIAAALLLYLTCRIHGRLPLPSGRQLGGLAVLGLTGVVSYNLFFFKGLTLVPAGRASVIIATNPIIITLSAALLFREPLSTRKLTGVVVSVCGAVIAISKGHPASLMQGGLGWGEVLIFCCVLSWVVYTLVGKAILGDLSPLVAVTYAALFGTIGLGIPALGAGLLAQVGGYSLVNWLSLAYLGVFGTVVGFIWYYEGVRAIGAARASLFINFVPLGAIVMAFGLLGEPVTLSLVAGTLLVVCGVYLTSTPGRKDAIAAEDPVRREPV
ncbi:MAG: DMT family transporter [Desulfosarcinaceae bacterium]|nr:DMT family transporter [Desulfosarcinaceae bacterium]